MITKKEIFQPLMGARRKIDTIPEERLIFARDCQIARKKAQLTQRAIKEKTGFEQSWISELETRTKHD